MGQTFSIEEAADRDEITEQLQTRQLLVTGLNVVQFIGIVFLLMETLVTGYAIVTAPGGSIALPHAVWVVAPIFACLSVAMFSRFEVGYYVENYVNGIYYCYGVLAAAIVVEGVFLAFLVVEIMQQTSNFYTESFGFLVGTIVCYGALIAIDLFLGGALYVLRRDVVKAYMMGWRPSYKTKDPKYKKSQPNDDKPGSFGDAPDDPVKYEYEQIRKSRKPVNRGWGIK